MANQLDDVTGIEGILDINERKRIEQENLNNAREQAQNDFDVYARDLEGDPLNLDKVEEYKSQVEPWRFEQSLYGLQEDHFNATTPEQANANSRFTPILDKYLLDNPDAFRNLDDKQNKDQHIARTLREEEHYYPMFSGENRGEFPELKDSEFQRLAVGSYFAEASDVDFDSVMKNMDVLASSYAQANGLDSANVSSVFHHIKGDLTQRKTQRDNDKANWQNGISSVLNGLSLNESIAGSTNDTNGTVTSASRSAFMNEFSRELPKATEFYEKFTQTASRGDRARAELKMDFLPIKMMGGVLKGVSAFNEMPKQQKDAIDQLVLMPREQRRKTIALMYMMAEENAGELDAGFFGKTGESFARGLGSYIANVGDGVDASIETSLGGRGKDYNRARREMRQDLGDIKEIVAEIKSDSKMAQGVYDSARSLPYQLSAMLPYGSGVFLNSLAMATDNDMKLRKLYPDMDNSQRWGVASSAAVVQSAIERASFKTAFKKFPSASKYLAGKGALGKVGMVGLRGAGILAVENLEESLQSATLPVMQSIWGAFAEDIPDVSDEDWEESMFLYDERTFFATLPLAVLGAGGKSAMDIMGANSAGEMLSDVDRVMLHGFNRSEAELIANEPDSLKKFFMFQEGSSAKSPEQRKELSDEAVNGGALDRIVEKDEAEAFKAYEDNINENGTEEDKTKLEVEKLARDYSKKYDAQITQDGDQFKVTFPEGKPAETYETKDEADSAIKAHRVEVNEGYLEALSSASANVQAMRLQKKTLETKHKGAKVKLDAPIVGLKEFAEKSEANMAQALERIEHELIKTGEVRPATKADLDRWHTRGEVKLKKDARGYVARLAEGANIADLVEEGSEGFLRDIIKAGLIDSKWVKEQIINYQTDTGNKLTASDNVDGMSDQQMIEAFSDLAVGNFYNAHQQDQTGKLGSIINALRIFFAKVATIAEDLLTLQTEGKIDADFQTLLDNSVGLDMDAQIDRQTDEATQEILGDTNMSIAPEMSADEKKVGEGADTEAGTPAPDQPSETLLPDDSKPQIDWTDPSYSVAPKNLPEAFPLMTEEIAKQVLAETDTTSAIHIDRMRVGEFEGVSLQGGMFYPSILENLNARIAWAFNSVGVARTVVDRAALHGGYVKLVLMTEGNVVGNKTFATIWLNRMDNVLDTDEKKAEFMAEFHKVRLSAIKSIVNNKRRAEKKAKVAAEEKGEQPVEPVDEMTLATYHRDGEKVTSYDQVRKFMLDMGQSDRGSHYLTRSTRSSDTKDGKNKKGDTMYGKLLGVQLSNKRGYPIASEIVNAIEEPAFKGMKKGDVVGLIKLDAIEKGSPIQTAKEAGVTEHISYGYIVKGEPVAKMKDIHNIEEMYPSIAGQMMSQQKKSYDAKEHITFSIGTAQDATYMDAVNSGDMDTAQAMVDAKAKEAGYDVEGFHGKAGDIPEVFNPTNDGANTSWESRPATFFAVERDHAQMFADHASTRTGDDANVLRAYLKTGESVEKFSTEETVSALKERGVNSTILKDIESGEIIEYAVFDPNQIKSADPVTYDSDGNVIPLSQRFDSSRDEISFSIGRAKVTPTANTQMFPTEDGGVVGAASFSIGAWHGTPHKVDEFSTKNIGTGEGVQAYGWGLYYAEDKGVAEGYRDMVVDSNVIYQGKTGYEWNKYFHDKGEFDKALVWEHILNFPKNTVDVLVKDNQTAKKYLSTLPESIFNHEPNLYKVELNVEQDELLDWDQALLEQPQRIQDVFLSMGMKPDFAGGSSFYNQLAGALNESSDVLGKNDKQASEALASAGIKGIKYLDGNSRSDGEGTSNYVIFNDKDIRITEENGKVVDTTFSLAPAEDAVMERITSLMRDPDAKLEVYRDMARRLNKVRDRIYSKRIAYGKMTAESMSEADKEMDERDFIISSVAQIEAIARVLPPQVSRKLGTMKRASEYKTSKGFARYVSQRLDKVDDALEKYLRKELRADVSKLVKQSQPKSKQKASDTGQSKIGVIGHRVAQAAKLAMKMSPEQAGREAEGLRLTLSEMDDPAIEKIQEMEDVAYIYEMFADFDNADSNRLTMMKNLMKSNWDEGRKQWLNVLEARKAWKDNKVKAVVSSLSKMGKSITEKNNSGGMSSKLANAAREQLSFYNVTDLLREDMKGEGSEIIKEMTGDLRRANNSFEWAQLQHKEEMKQVFADIFGMKGANKTARVQARLNSLAKEIDWGNQVTVVDRDNTDQRISVGKMSQLDLLKDWLAVQQLDLKNKYDKSGHDEAYRSQLEAVLDDDVIELGLWMQNKLREMTPDTEKLHRSEYGLAMATVENYFPAVFEHKLSNTESNLTIDGIDVAGVSKRPSAHKMRVNHKSDPMRQNAVHIFNHHIMQDAFWKSHAEVLRKWAGVLRSPDVQNAIKASKGVGFLSEINKRLNDIETQGSAVAQIQLESDLFARSLGKGMSLGILGLKLSTIWKNFSALSNVALGVEAKELITGLRPEVFKEAKELLKTETFQRRLKMGASVATRYALEGGKRGNIVFTTTERLAEVGVQGINIADTGSNLTMAIAYVARLKKLRAEGVTDADARAQALDHVDDLMARYAQPTDRLSKSMFENRRMPLVSFLVMFQSEARKQMAINSLAVRKLMTGKGAQSKSLAAQQLLVQVVGVNAFIHVVSSLYGALFKGYGEGDDAEEKFMNDMKDGTKLASMMLSESFSGIPIAGEVISTSVKKLMGQDVFSSSSNPLTRTFGTGAQQMLSTTAKWDERSPSENADALLRGIQMMASVAPQTAFASQVANVGRDSLGFLNNALATGLTEQDTFDIYEKRIKKVVTKVNESTKEEMKQAKDDKDRRMIRSIDNQRKEDIIARAREIMLEMDTESRSRFLKQQEESDKSIQKYLIKQFKIDF